METPDSDARPPSVSQERQDSLSVDPPLRVLLLHPFLGSFRQSDDRVSLAGAKREQVNLAAERTERLVEGGGSRPPSVADELPVIELPNIEHISGF